MSRRRSRARTPGSSVPGAASARRAPRPGGHTSTEPAAERGLDGGDGERADGDGGAEFRCHARKERRGHRRTAGARRSAVKPARYAAVPWPACRDALATRRRPSRSTPPAGRPGCRAGRRDRPPAVRPELHRLRARRPDLPPHDARAGGYRQPVVGRLQPLPHLPRVRSGLHRHRRDNRAAGAGVIAAFPASILSDRYGRRLVLAAGAAGVTLAIGGLLLTTSGPAILVLAGVMGAANQAFFVVQSPFLMERSRPEHRSELF